jgi:hypothetical protein
MLCIRVQQEARNFLIPEMTTYQAHKVAQATELDRPAKLWTIYSKEARTPTQSTVTCSMQTRDARVLNMDYHLRNES